jgi:hypothetical protein
MEDGTSNISSMSYRYRQFALSSEIINISGRTYMWSKKHVPATEVTGQNHVPE